MANKLPKNLSSIDVAKRLKLEADISSGYIRDLMGTGSEMLADLYSKLLVVTKDRNDYKKAKEENDERFMRERDEARERVGELEKEVSDLKKKLMTQIGQSASLSAQLDDPREEEEVRVPEEGCPHPQCQVTFDPAAAQKLTVEEIRKRWPRFYGPCPDCGQQMIVYASFSHYIYGDW